MATKLNPGVFDCYANALPDEPMFVLLARDPKAPPLVREWADDRAVDIINGIRPDSDLSQVTEARECADAMEMWRPANWPVRRGEVPGATETKPGPAKLENWQMLPDGEYAIVDLMGHNRIVGRCAEIDRFGVKMICVEPLFDGRLLSPVYRSGSALYGYNPCSREQAWAVMPTNAWSLPEEIRALLPEEEPQALPAPQSYSYRVEAVPVDDDPDLEDIEPPPETPGSDGASVPVDLVRPVGAPADEIPF